MPELTAAEMGLKPSDLGVTDSSETEPDLDTPNGEGVTGGAIGGAGSALKEGVEVVFKASIPTANR